MKTARRTCCARSAGRSGITGRSPCLSARSHVPTGTPSHRTAPWATDAAPRDCGERMMEPHAGGKWQTNLALPAPWGAHLLCQSTPSPFTINHRGLAYTRLIWDDKSVLFCTQVNSVLLKRGVLRLAKRRRFRVFFINES